MTDIPEGAKVPQDHKLGKVEQFSQGLEALGLSANVLPVGLRPRQRNQVMALALGLRDLAGAEEGQEEVELDADSLSDEQLKKLLDVIADFDDIMADEATDPEAYAAWSRLADYEAFSTLLALYGGFLGESTGSAS